MGVVSDDRAGDAAQPETGAGIGRLRIRVAVAAINGSAIPTGAVTVAIAAVVITVRPPVIGSVAIADAAPGGTNVVAGALVRITGRGSDQSPRDAADGGALPGVMMEAAGIIANDGASDAAKNRAID